MIRVRILRGTVGDGGRTLAVGEELRLPDDEARLLIGIRKAEAILDLPEGAAPVPQHGDLVATRARGRGKR